MRMQALPNDEAFIKDTSAAQLTPEAVILVVQKEMHTDTHTHKEKRDKPSHSWNCCLVAVDKATFILIKYSGTIHVNHRHPCHTQRLARTAYIHCVRMVGQGRMHIAYDLPKT